MNTAIRLVKCPKCRKILPEQPNIPVYKCGGCGTILQAKRQKYDIKGNDLRAPAPDPQQKYEPNSVSSSSSPGGDHDHPSLDSSPRSGTRGEQFNSVKPVVKNSSDDYSHQDDKSFPEKNESAVKGERERLLDQDDVQRKSEPLIHISKKPHDRISGKLSDSCDSLHEDEDSSTEISNSGKKYDIKENDLRPQATDPIQKDEHNSVSSSSSPGGDNPFVESSAGSDTRGDQFSSVKPINTNSSDDYSHSTEVNYHQDDKSSPEKNETEVQGKLGLLDQDGVQRKSEPLIHIREKPHDRTSGELADSCDSLHENEDSSTETSNSGKKCDINGNDLRPQETDPIQKYEPSSVSNSSNPGGDNPFVESSSGSDTGGNQFNSVKPVDTHISDDYSHSTEVNYLQDDKSSPEKNESEVQGEGERLLDQDAARCTGESLFHSTEKLHHKTSGELSDSCDSLHENEDSSTKISNSGKKYDINGNDLRPQETYPVQKYEPSSVSNSSNQRGDDPLVESSPGSDTGQFNSVKPVNTNSSDDYSHSTEVNYLQDDKSSPEKNESEVQGEGERLLDQDAAWRTGESLFHSTEKLHYRTSGELSDSCDSLHENEDSSTEISNSGKKYDINGNDLRPQETYPVQKYEPSSVSNSSNPGVVESSPGSDTGQFNSVKPVNTNSSDDYSHSTEVNYLQDDKSFPEKNESEVQGECERLLDQDAAQCTGKSLFHSTEKLHGRTSGELSDSYDSLHENEDSSIEISNSGKKYEEGFLPKLNVVISVNVLEDSHGVLAEEEKSSGEPKSLDEPETTSFPKSEPLKLVVAKVQQNIENGIERYPNDIEEFQGELENPNDQQSLNEPATHFSVNEPLKLDEENKPSSEDKEHSKVDERRYLSTENGRMKQNEFPHQIVEYSQKKETEKESSSFSVKGKEITAARAPLVKSIVFAPLTPDDEYLQGFQEVGPSFHRISSEETLDTLPINPRVPIGSMSKSPTRIYYAGDESESSFDGEGLSTQVSRVRKFKGTGATTTNRLRQTDGFRNKNKQNGDLQMHNEQLDLLSKLKQPNIFSGAESPEHRKHGHPVRTSTIAANNEHISRGSYMTRSSPLFYGNSTPASSTHSVFLQNGEFRRPDTMSASDPEKIQLLRMVHELKDKINRTQMSGEILRTAGYYDDPTTGRNAHVDFKHSGQQRSPPQGVGWDNQHRSSRQALSGEAVLCRNHIDCRCSHCYHQSLHFSRKLSSHCIHCEHEAYNTYPSCSPSRQHYSSSEISREIQADNRNRDNEMKMSYWRGKAEKHQVIKRHFRPVCGGAPIVNCYHCSELLQIPADFLLFRRRCHHLRCNACNRILKFSLLEKSHLVPYVIKIQAPPPGKIVDRTLASTSHANKPQAGEPVSFSDDFEPSLSRNGSTESGPSVPSSHRKNLSNGKLPSNQTSQPYRKAKTFMEIYQDKNKNSRISISGAGPSSSTEIEEVAATSGSVLHRLMGYASPRQVLFAKSEDDSDDGMGFYMDQHIK